MNPKWSNTSHTGRLCRGLSWQAEFLQGRDFARCIYRVDLDFHTHPHHHQAFVTGEHFWRLMCPAVWNYRSETRAVPLFVIKDAVQRCTLKPQGCHGLSFPSLPNAFLITQGSPGVSPWRAKMQNTCAGMTRRPPEERRSFTGTFLIRLKPCLVFHSFMLWKTEATKSCLNLIQGSKYLALFFLSSKLNVGNKPFLR